MSIAQKNVAILRGRIYAAAFTASGTTAIVSKHFSYKRAT